MNGIIDRAFVARLQSCKFRNDALKKTKNPEVSLILLSNCSLASSQMMHYKSEPDITESATVVLRAPK